MGLVLWYVSSRSMYRRTNTRQIWTNYKCVWLCPYIGPSQPSSCSQITSAMSKGFCHNYLANTEGPPIITCLPDPIFTDVPSWVPKISFPVCQITLPTPLHKWRCSTATLHNVPRLRKSARDRVLFDYGKYSNVVGDFRPSEGVNGLWPHDGLKSQLQVYWITLLIFSQKRTDMSRASGPWKGPSSYGSVKEWLLFKRSERKGIHIYWHAKTTLQRLLAHQPRTLCYISRRISGWSLSTSV